jgi:cytochrome c-type biogenesis protein CcmH
MMPYFLTALAGIAVILVGYRVWKLRDAGGGEPADVPEANAAKADGLPPAATRGVLVGAGVLVLAAIAIFAFRGPSDAGTETSSAMAAPQAGASKAIDDVDTMIARLAKRLEKEPGDGEGFRMLGWSYLMTGHPEKAIEPYKRALALLPGKANVQAGYGEALVGTSGNKVTPEARAVFEKAIALDPAEPRARYFMALWQAQNGSPASALDSWIELANGAPTDAPWLTDVQTRIKETSAKLGVDVSARLKSAASPAAGGTAPTIDSAAVQAANQMPAGDRQKMIDGMVEGLAAKLKSNPGDADGWVRLLRSRMVLNQADQARADLELARKALSGDAAKLRTLEAGAKEFGVPGAK